MKCAKEVMEQWKVSTEKMYTENLMKMIDTITGRLFEQASDGTRTSVPRVWVYTSLLKDGPEGARMVYLSNKKEAIPVKWNELELALKMLCYEVKPIYPDSEEYCVSPNPPC
jgi:hypothetical protein